MWFKNLQVYRFTRPFEATAEMLNEQLSTKYFKPCGSQELFRSGWVPPLGRHGVEYIHVTNGYMMLCSKRQDKVLPASVVNEAVEEKALVIQQDEARNVGRKERQSIKDDVIFELLPKAFARSSLVFAYISPKEGLLIINAASAKRAEDLISDLRETIGSLPLIPLTPNNIPQHVMTRWVDQGHGTKDFEIGAECELRDNADNTSIIRCKNKDLTSSEIISHLKAGMYVNKLALNWQERIECVVDEKLAIKRLKFSDIVQEKADEVDAESAAEQFDVDFSIMSLELSVFIAALIDAFGGEDLSAMGKDDDANDVVSDSKVSENKQQETDLEFVS